MLMFEFISKAQTNMIKGIQSMPVAYLMQKHGSGNLLEPYSQLVGVTAPSVLIPIRD